MVQRQQSRQNIVVRKICRPAIGSGNGLVQRAMEGVQPGAFRFASLIVEGGKCAPT